MSRKNAFLGHFVLSFLVVSTVLAIVFFLWYPGLYFQVTGAREVLQVLVGVDLVLGPVLTLLLYKPQKPGLVVDICLIACIQLSALVYGVSVIYEERPYYMVFSVDRFEVLAHKDAVFDEATDPAMFSKPWGQPVVVVANMPTDVAEKQRLMDETLFHGKPDIHQRPEFWSSYEESADKVIANARPLAELQELGPGIAAEVQRLREQYQGDDRLVYLPVMGKKQVFSLVLDKESRQPIEIVNADPWEQPVADSDEGSAV